jgi:hypothetical protein
MLYEVDNQKTMTSFEKGKSRWKKNMNSWWKQRDDEKQVRENMKSRYDMLLMNLRLGHNYYMGPTFLTSVLLFSKQPSTVVTSHHTFYHKNKQPLSLPHPPYLPLMSSFIHLCPPLGLNLLAYLKFATTPFSSPFTSPLGVQNQ